MQLCMQTKKIIKAELLIRCKMPLTFGFCVFFFFMFYYYCFNTCERGKSIKKEEIVYTLLFLSVLIHMFATLGALKSLKYVIFNFLQCFLEDCTDYSALNII